MILSLKDISINFSGLKALSNVDISVNKGIIKGIIGPNGSGKTTLFNIISGFYKPTSGKIFLEEEDITGDAPYILNRKGIARTFQGVLLFNDRTVLENVLVATYSKRKDVYFYSFLPNKISRRKEAEDIERVEEILNKFGLIQYKNEYIKSLPFGIRHFSEIARCLATNPKIILLDEPTTGLNPVEQQQFIKIINDIKSSGITILIVEHNMKLIMNVCDSISVLDQGIKIAEGTPLEIRSNKKVIESYLGSEGVNA